MTQNKVAVLGNAIGNLRTNAKMRKAASKNLVDAKKDANKKEKESLGEKVTDVFNKSIGSKKASVATPPPIPVTAFYVAVGNQQTGPFDLDTLSKMAQGGSLSANTLVWKEGMKEWKPAKETAELKDLFVTE